MTKLAENQRIRNCNESLTVSYVDISDGSGCSDCRSEDSITTCNGDGCRFSDKLSSDP